VETLILFTKAPLPGKTKTRLAKERGDDAALRLSTAFLTDTAALCGRWRSRSAEAGSAVDANRRLAFYVDPLVEDPILVDLAWKAGARLELQQGKDLGERLRHAFDAELARGARAVCAIGSDSPTLPLHLLDHAFRALLWERVIIGPTFDGGYWLVGAQRPAPNLFDNIPWSTAAVVARTASLLRTQGLAAHLLPFWYDVDEASDLERLVWHLKALHADSGGRSDDAHVSPATFQALLDVGLIHAAVTAPQPPPPEPR
jgi:rSAM/selenodomain-associated transferase 1